MSTLRLRDGAKKSVHCCRTSTSVYGDTRVPAVTCGECEYQWRPCRSLGLWAWYAPTKFGAYDAAYPRRWRESGLSCSDGKGGFKQVPLKDCVFNHEHLDCICPFDESHAWRDHLGRNVCGCQHPTPFLVVGAAAATPRSASFEDVEALLPRIEWAGRPEWHDFAKMRMSRN